MNVDQLIQDADPAVGATVPGPDSPVARQSFERAVAVGNSRMSHSPAKPVAKRGSRLSGIRGRAVIATAAAAAGAAAAVTAIVMPSAPVGSAPKVTGPPPRTAAAVLDQAAQAAGSRAGWPNARYWYIESQYMCDGQLYTDKDWLSRYGNGVAEKSGPKDGPLHCSGGLFTVPILGDNMFGPYTWSQLYTLPTDPATLKPKLMADFNSPDQQTLFADVEELLVDTPAPPAVLEALFKVDASIPGVKVVGQYTDSLGRTGTALELGGTTMVINPASGVVLDDTDAVSSTVMFVTQGPVSSEPKPARWVW
jgi:hypothetical protein